MTYCYSPAPTKCSGKAQPGTRILRDTMDDLVPELGDMGIYNCRDSSGGGGLSRHANGTAWDAGTSTLALNLKIGDFFVAAAQDLGIQRVICYGPRYDGTVGPREWDSREGERRWERYTGPSAHLDHAHTELCWRASQELTAAQVKAAYDKYWPKEGPFMALTDAEQKEVLAGVRDIKAALLGPAKWSSKTMIGAILKALVGRRKNPDTGAMEDYEELAVVVKDVAAIKTKLGA